MSEDVHFTTILLMVREDNQTLTGPLALDTALRVYSHPGKPGACVHRMPEGLSAFFHGKCVRCGERREATQ